VDLFARTDISHTFVLLEQTKCSPDFPSDYLYATEPRFKTSDVEIGLSPVLTGPCNICSVPSKLRPQNVLFAEQPFLMARRGASSPRLAFRFERCSHCTHVILSTQRYRDLKILFLLLHFMH
jgi:hypothetical protein